MKDVETETENGEEIRAFFEHLTGPSRGKVSWATADHAIIVVLPDRTIRLRPAFDESTDGRPIAELAWTDSSYTLEALEGQKIWVNGRLTGSAQLRHGDMVEMGETGPMSRFRLCNDSYPLHWTVEDIASDTIAYFRTSRRPIASRASTAIGEFLRRTLLNTTVLFRIAVTLILIGFAVLGVLQYRTNLILQESLRTEAYRLEAVAAAIEKAREEALQPGDLKRLREELDIHLTTNAERLAALERRSKAAARVIEASVRSVAFLQGAYGLRDNETGRLLRHVLDDKGAPRMTPLGQSVISPDGDGPIVEAQFTGTGFLLGDGRYLVTNRHVALPWATKEKLEVFAAHGLKPEMLRLVAFFHGHPTSIEASLHLASEAADISLLALDAPPPEETGLSMAEGLPAPGEEVIVMGFPTGLQALLLQAGPDFLKDLESSGDDDFWKVAARLAESDLMVPLASRGIVAKTAESVIVYDAETAHGGSGGPVLDLEGRVVGIIAAVLPEFGGSNIGVSVAELKALLLEARHR